jgi:ribonuclease HI
MAAEKAERLKHDHPSRLALQPSEDNAQPAVRHRTVRQSWRSFVAREKSNLKSIQTERRPINLFPFPPWTSAPNLTVRTKLHGIESKHDPKEKIVNAALTAIREVDPSLTIYTDGSLSAGTTNGGSAAVFTIGDPANPTILDTICRKGAVNTCSYEEELDAMEIAAEEISEMTGSGHVMICSDSQSVCQALDDNNTDTSRVQYLISQYKGDVTIQWLPGHAGIPGNEAADQAAKDATQLQATPRATRYESACSAIAREVKDGPPAHERVREVYSCYSKAKEKYNSRHDQSNLARIRAGHHLVFQAFQHRMDETVDPSCPECWQEPQTMEHWFLRCPSTVAAKHEIFQEEHEMGLALLSKYPQKSITLAAKSLFRKDDAGAQQ